MREEGKRVRALPETLPRGAPAGRALPGFSWSGRRVLAYRGRCAPA
jgi:hypothetical protein